MGTEILNKSVQREETSELWCVSMSVHGARLLDTYCRSTGLQVSEAVGRLWAVQRGNPRACCGPKGFSGGGGEE